MNELKHIDEFSALLAGYQPSDAAKEVLSRTKLVLLVGPTSSGRNTIINELLKAGKYHFVVSDTTRKPRKNNGILEKNGREYWFRKEEDLLNELRTGQFLEAAIIHKQQVSGMSVRELRAAADEDKIAINEIEVVGADNVHNVKPDTIFLFVIPPSFDEWMARMKSRGELPKEEIIRRLKSAVDEIARALDCEYYRFVVNETFMHTARTVEAMIEKNSIDTELQARSRAVAAQLLKDTQKHLATLE
jgi:guanylate kinase